MLGVLKRCVEFDTFKNIQKCLLCRECWSLGLSQVEWQVTLRRCKMCKLDLECEIKTCKNHTRKTKRNDSRSVKCGSCATEHWTGPPEHPWTSLNHVNHVNHVNGLNSCSTIDHSKPMSTMVRWFDALSSKRWAKVSEHNTRSTWR